MSQEDREKQLKLFRPKRNVQPFVQLDHAQRRRDKEVAEIAQAAKRLAGMSAEQVGANIRALETLLPDLAPNLDKMKASDWVKLVKDVNRVAMLLVVLKTHYPGVNLGAVVNRNPKILLKDVAALAADAKQVRALLGDKLANLDEVVQACPDLMVPAQAMLSINTLKRTFPTQDPYALLQKNPNILYSMHESDTKPDPTYGWESNFFNTGCMADSKPSVWQSDVVTALT